MYLQGRVLRAPVWLVRQTFAFALGALTFASLAAYKMFSIKVQIDEERKVFRNVQRELDKTR